jgi:hypothetical protein
MFKMWHHLRKKTYKIYQQRKCLQKYLPSLKKLKIILKTSRYLPRLLPESECAMLRAQGVLLECVRVVCGLVESESKWRVAVLEP